eukprot:TRINITY_DN2101_c1_g1_i1.p1 TRINITY_DN2101_c1_g1~~TRINITY_DN2101_c1_g1_i1.p1  ORF type:complete len:871 (+),score=183.67 TRINITY_DN2101_c1_g1_i1:45-2657(+)
MAGTGLTQILLNAQDATNAQLREQALHTIEQAQEQSLEQFIGSLMQELANDQAPQASRHLAGLLLKNTMAARSHERREAQAAKWLASSGEIRTQVKTVVLSTLRSQQREVRMTAALVAAHIARIELPQNQWPSFVGDICGAAQQQVDVALREAALATIGWVCEETADSPALQAFLQPHCSGIARVIVAAMKKEETNQEVRHQGAKALLSSLEFMGGPFEVADERNHIMQAVCEGASRQFTQNPTTRECAMESLARIVALYYHLLMEYMTYLFQSTLDTVRNDQESVGLQGIEFWTTMAEVETELLESAERGVQTGIECRNYVRGACTQLVATLWECLLRQDETADDGEWNLCGAATICFQNMAACMHDHIVQDILGYVRGNIQHAEWRNMEAATMLFGCVLEGTETNGALATVWQEAVPALLSHMAHTNELVRDTTAWCIGRIAEHHPPVILDYFMADTIRVMSTCLQQSSPRVAAKASYALLHIAAGVGVVEDDTQRTNRMSQYFADLASKLLAAVDRPDAGQDRLRSSAWEALVALVASAAYDTFPVVQALLPNLVERLQQTFAFMAAAQTPVIRQQVAETQGLVCGLLNYIARKLDTATIAPHADGIMQCFLTLFAQSAQMAAGTDKMLVQEEMLMAAGAIAASIGAAFTRYLSAFVPYLIECLKCVEQEQVCSVAVGCLVDVVCAVRGAIAEHGDGIMSVLLQNLRDGRLAREVKPTIIGTFGDIALHLGAGFDRYLDVTVNVVQTAVQTVQAEVRAQGPQHNPDLMVYQNEVREAVCQAFTALQGGGLKKKERKKKKNKGLRDASRRQDDAEGCVRSVRSERAFIPRGAEPRASHRGSGGAQGRARRHRRPRVCIQGRDSSASEQ